MHIALRAAIEECMIQNLDFDPALEKWYENAKNKGRQHPKLIDL